MCIARPARALRLLPGFLRLARRVHLLASRISCTSLQPRAPITSPPVSPAQLGASLICAMSCRRKKDAGRRAPRPLLIAQEDFLRNLHPLSEIIKATASGKRPMDSRAGRAHRLRLRMRRITSKPMRGGIALCCVMLHCLASHRIAFSRLARRARPSRRGVRATKRACNKERPARVFFIFFSFLRQSVVRRGCIINEWRESKCGWEDVDDQLFRV